MQQVLKLWKVKTTSSSGILKAIDEVIENLFESILNNYQNNWETSMRDSDFIFDCVHYKCQHKSKSCFIIYRFSCLDKKQKYNTKSYP